MLGQPASSHTVCRPSRRTSDFSWVYSGPVLSRVLIHSGLRSIGTWLLRTSRRRSFRPAGSRGEPVAGVGTTGSLMISTVPGDGERPRCRAAGPFAGTGRGSGLVAAGPRRLAGVAGLVRGVLIALGELLRLLAEVRVGW